MFVAKEGSGTAVAVIPKSGSQTIRHCCRYQVDLTNDEALRYQTRVAFIRNPIERLKSAYSFFHYLMKDGVKTDGTAPPYSSLGSWQDFVDFALENKNPHWLPQVQHLYASSGEFVPNAMHKFEEIREHWEKYYKGALPWLNATSRAPTNDYKLDEINAYYLEDLELWHSL